MISHFWCDSIESKAMDNIDGCQILHSEVGQDSLAYYIWADENSFCNTSYTIEVSILQLTVLSTRDGTLEMCLKQALHLCSHLRMSACRYIWCCDIQNSMKFFSWAYCIWCSPEVSLAADSCNNFIFQWFLLNVVNFTSCHFCYHMIKWNLLFIVGCGTSLSIIQSVYFADYYVMLCRLSSL